MLAEKRKVQRNNPFNLPRRLAVKYKSVDAKFIKFLNDRDFHSAKVILTKLFNEIIIYQDKLNKRFHKGGVLHNLGIIFLLQQKYEKAFKFFIMAFSEDIAAEIEGYAGDPENTPAGKVLLDIYLVDNKLITDLNSLVRVNHSTERFRNPIVFYSSYLTSNEIKKDISRNRISDLIRTEKISIDCIPGEWEKRVFVGGSYSIPRYENLLKIKEFVRNKNFVPIFVEDFLNKEGLTTNKKSLLLLNNCKYAIFDVTINSGHLIEVQEAKNKDIVSIMVYQDIPKEKLQITSMIKDFFGGPKKFSSETELGKIIDEFLLSVRQLSKTN